jgi:hypothetical protein
VDVVKEGAHEVVVQCRRRSSGLLKGSQRGPDQRGMAVVARGDGRVLLAGVRLRAPSAVPAE